MFVDLTMFNSEKETYNNKVMEIQASEIQDDIKMRKLEDEEFKYKNSLRKYLSASINKVNEVYPFSLYKMGKDIDAKFKVIEIKVRKSKQEIEKEFAENMHLVESLDEKNKNLVKIAMAVIVDYSDDKKEDQSKEDFLNGR